MNIGENIIKLRKLKGWSQYRLYKEAGIGQSTLSQIESGIKKNPNSDTLKKIANALNVSMDEFYGNNFVSTVIDHADKMDLEKSQRAVIEKYKKEPPEKQLKELMEVVDKIKNLPDIDREVLIRIINAFASHSGV